MPLLDIRNLTIEFITPNGLLRAVDHINLKLNEGEILGLVGESGSGKSLIAKTILGAINNSWKVSADRFYFNGIDLLKLTAKQRQKIISSDISMIYQEPQSCLDPTMKIGRLLIESIPRSTFKGRFWQRLFWRKNRAIELLHKVGIKEHSAIMNCYPNELTEGECQKVMIAIALATQPKLLIADEPTNSMESTTEAQIFRLLASLNQNNDTTILLISHDLQMITRWTDRVNVLYCGQTVEIAETEELSKMAYHPYTQTLMQAIPDFGTAMPHKSPLNTLAGVIPPLEHLPIGCRLGPRCPYAQKKCIETPKLVRIRNRAVACHFPLNVDMQEFSAKEIR